MGTASITSDSRPSQPPITLTLRLTLRQVGLRVVNVVNRTTLVMSADETMLRNVGASLVSRGRPDVFAPLLQTKWAASAGMIKDGPMRHSTCPDVACKERRPHLCRCHLRFNLNRKPMQFMRHLLCMQSFGVERQRQLRTLREAHFKGQDDLTRKPAKYNQPSKIISRGRSLMTQIENVAKHLPDIVPLLPTEADLLPATAATATASAVAASTAVAAFRQRPDAATPIQPLQPQLNALQRSAVQDVVSHRHGSAPYIVFGPPGTGKTMVMLECVLQAFARYAYAYAYAYAYICICICICMA